MAENAERIIKKISVYLLLFGIFLFASVSPALADSRTIIQGNVSSDLAGNNIHIVCQPSNFNYPNEDVYTGSRWPIVDKNGHYSVSFTKSECDSGEYVFFADMDEYIDCPDRYDCWLYRNQNNNQKFTVNDERNITADFSLGPIKHLEVPEYNSLTYILAIVGSFGLFLYFRKRNKNPFLQCSN